MLNEAYSEGLRTALSRGPANLADDAAIISIDRLGADVRVRRATDYIVERLTFSSVRRPDPKVLFVTHESARTGDISRGSPCRVLQNIPLRVRHATGLRCQASHLQFGVRPSRARGAIAAACCEVPLVHVLCLLLSLRVRPPCLQHVHTLEEALEAMDTVLQNAQAQKR